MDIAGPIGEWIGAGASAGGGAVVVWKLFDWFGTRVDKREDVLTRMAQVNAEATAALILNLQDQVTKVCARLDLAEAELVECHASKARLEEEMAKLRGQLQGIGDIRNEVGKINAAVALNRKEERHGDR